MLKHLGEGYKSARCIRQFSKSEITVLSRWLEGWQSTPPVVSFEESEPPTALSWLRRKGPSLPNPILRRLFRDRVIRVWNPETDQVKRVAEDALLPPGARLLLPKHLGEGTDHRGENDTARSLFKSTAQQAPYEQRSEISNTRRSSSSSSSSDTKRHDALIQQLRDSILFVDHHFDFIALNKPAGLAVQGGSGVGSRSVDALMAAALEDVVQDSGQLRLVHRLDKSVTGVLLLAKNAEAASWLGDAFRRAAEQNQHHQHQTRDPPSQTTPAKDAPQRAPRNKTMKPGGFIQKEYWAVACREPSQVPEDSPHLWSGVNRHGTINQPIPRVDEKSPRGGGGGSSVAAITEYEFLTTDGHGPKSQETNNPLALLKLQPVTGRKHQLRLHCAQVLEAPILGDTKYGRVRAGAQRRTLHGLGLTMSGGGVPGQGPPIFLHCKKLVVRPPYGLGGRKRDVVIEAPLPEVWKQLFRNQHWRGDGATSRNR